MASIPLPALDVRPPQQPDPMGDVSKLMAMKSMLGQQQVQQQQLQAGQLENQQREMDLKDQQNMRSLAPQFLKKDDSGKATGFDADGYYGALMGAGVSPSKIAAMQKAQNDAVLSKAQAGSAALKLEDEKNDQGYQILEGIRSSKNPAAAYASALPKIQALGVDMSQLPQQYPGDDHLAQVEVGLGVHKQVLADAHTTAETAKNATDAALNQNKVDVINAWKTDPKKVLGQVDSIVPPSGPNAALNARTKSQVQFSLSNGDVDGAKAAIKQAAEQVGAVEKDVQVAKATQPLKIETAEAEGRARQLVEGMEKPVWALDAQGNRTLMSATDAIKSGVRTMVPTNDKDVTDAIMLNNRLGDVRQKIARYEQALGGLGTTVSAADQGNIAALIGKGAVKVGAFGTELPMDRLNAALQKENISGLSDDAKKLLVSYYNARESMQGYQRVLSGTGRANEKAMELNLDALPNPATSDKSYAAESLKQFRENLGIVGQGIGRIPGIKTPEEIEAGALSPQNKPAAPGAGFTVTDPRGVVHTFPDQPSADKFKKLANIQ